MNEKKKKRAKNCMRLSLVHNNAKLEEKAYEVGVEVNKEVGLAQDFGQAASTERRRSRAAEATKARKSRAHATRQPVARRNKKAAAVVVSNSRRQRWRRRDMWRQVVSKRRVGARRRAAVARGRRRRRGVGLHRSALGLGIGQLLDPRGQIVEGGRNKAKGLHRHALAVGVQGYQGVHALVAARVHVRDTENVGRSVAGRRVAEEQRPAISCGRCSCGNARGAVLG